MEQDKQQTADVLRSALEMDLRDAALEFDVKDLDWQPVEATYLARAAATCQTS